MSLNIEERRPLLNSDKDELKLSKKLKILIIVFIASFLILIFKFKSTKQDVIPHLVVGSQGAVAVELKECSDAGLEILKKNGTAVDAAIASALCIGVVNSFATGIGGGGFMLIRLANGTFEHIDFRETAPAAAYRDMFVKNPMAAQIGGLSVAVPGEIRGFELAHKRHGKVPWKDLFESAIKVASEGFEVTDLMYQKLVKGKSWIEISPGFSDVYAPSGVIAKPGDRIKRPTLATTLRTISIEGPDSFYTGEIAKSIVNATQAAGGILTLEDLEQYKALVRPTIQTFYHGRKVVTTSAPTSGPSLLSVLNIIEPYYFNVTGPTPLTIHRLIEAFKFSFAFRTEIGDPDFIHNEDRIEEIISKEWADQVRQNITDDSTHDYEYYEPKYENNDPHGTMHLSVVDKDNSAVSLTSTVNLSFGAKFMDPVTGIILNDELDDFSIPGVPNNFGLYPSPYNYIEPFKRPLSSITPLIPNEAQFETDYSQEILDALVKRNHELRNLAETGTVSAAQAVQRFINGTLHAASDPRKNGLAAAY